MRGYVFAFVLAGGVFFAVTGRAQVPPGSPSSTGASESADSTLPASSGSTSVEPAVPEASASVNAPESHWYDKFKIELWVDAYFSLNTNLPKVPSVDFSITPPAGGNEYRAEDQNNGFAINTVGLDVLYDPDPVGGAIRLRFGPGTWALGWDAWHPQLGLQYLLEGFVSWKPGGKESSFALYFGKFQTPFNGEYFDTWNNINYSQSILWWLGQPVTHTGILADWEIAPEIAIKAMIVNGWNNSISEDYMKSFGGQLILRPAKRLQFRFGYLVGPGPETPYTLNSPTTTTTGYGTTTGTIAQYDSSVENRLRHYFDFVANWGPIPRLRLLFNASYAMQLVLNTSSNQVQWVHWYGADLTAKVALTHEFYAALRGGYYNDPDRYTSGEANPPQFYSGTMTIGYVPAPALTVKLEGRVDSSDQAVFNSGVNGDSKRQATITLGVAGTTN